MFHPYHFRLGKEIINFFLHRFALHRGFYIHFDTHTHTQTNTHTHTHRHMHRHRHRHTDTDTHTDTQTDRQTFRNTGPGLSSRALDKRLSCKA